ncbi:MAG: hypothetical protein WBD40_09360 [Tepidisphaeraceae bacterium]
MARVDSIRSEVHRLIRAVPFRRFVLVLESGDRVLIEHPENIAFNPEAKEPGSDELYVITGRIRLFSTFGAVSSIALADQGGAAA